MKALANFFSSFVLGANTLTRGSVCPTQKMMGGKGRNTTPSSLMGSLDEEEGVREAAWICPRIIKKSVGSESC